MKEFGTVFLKIKKEIGLFWELKKERNWGVFVIKYKIWTELQLSWKFGLNCKTLKSKTGKKGNLKTT